MSRFAGRITLIVVAVVASWFGVRLTSTPRYETVYSAESLKTTCHKAVCLTPYYLRIGNTGSETIENIEIVLRDDVLDAMLPLRAMNFGKIRRTVSVTPDDGKVRIDIGTLEPMQVVELQFSLSTDSGASAPAWDDLLLRIAPKQGTSHKGSPEFLRLGRVVYTLLDTFI